MKKILPAVVFFGLNLMGCFKQPTGAHQPAALALQLRVAKWTLLEPEQENALARASAAAQVTRVEIYVISENDTLARATEPIAAGAQQFSASLEVPAGEDRRVIVEAWDDAGVESTAGLILRGIQTQIDVVPEAVQVVPLTLYPVPLSGRRVVLALGSASGVPGSSSNLMPLTLISADSLSGMQFDLNFDPAVISPQRLVPLAALPWNHAESNVVSNGQSLRILMFDGNGRRLPVFYDPAALANVEIHVNSAAAAGARSPLVISNALILDAYRNPLEVAAVQDTFYVVGGR